MPPKIQPRIQKQVEAARSTIEVNGQVIVGQVFDGAALIAERDTEIKGIHKGVTEVNAQFKDLAGMVKKQQAPIEQIFEYCENANEAARLGLNNVIDANNMQVASLGWGTTHAHVPPNPTHISVSSSQGSSSDKKSQSPGVFPSLFGSPGKK